MVIEDIQDIQSVIYTDETNTAVSVNGDVFVPIDTRNRHWQLIEQWVAQGNTIAPYVPPPVPTDAERIDAAFPQTDVAQVLFNVLFDMANQIRALQGNTAITKAQFKSYLQSKLP